MPDQGLLVSDSALVFSFSCYRLCRHLLGFALWSRRKCSCTVNKTSGAIGC